ncbi:hypothetical protein MRB53_034864 [Persea americana]|uniref:Uncharacterized protein n=1 Tax=Persea americana TaxID=3435 RepID=A0ACC2K310_PERAE|nr:hypothetical protein MRB53_034864 [Persea americana]
MVSHLHFICTFLVTFLIQPISSKQSYDVTECNATSVTTSASYLCTTSTKPCQAFTVYRTQEKYPTLSSISSLFNSDRTKLLTLNNLTELTSRNLPINRELLIPTYCTCSRNFSHSLLRYNSSSLDSYSTIACETFEGLSKKQMLEVQNRSTRNRGQQNSESYSPRSFQLSNPSPDLLDDVSKLKQPLFNYSFDELKTATGDFSEATKISKSLYRGMVHGSGMVIKQVNSAEAHRVIEILTTINHINIVKLQGCCHMNQPYLVFELAANGSLRNCLSDPLLARQLTWVRRMEIAFNITVGLHYIHCCTKPCYVHRNINSRVILITADWRAKISGFWMAKPLPQNNNEKDDSETNKWKDTIMVGRRGYLAPEYLYHSLASAKVDVFALGIVLLELISGREAVGRGCMLKDSVGFLGGLEGSSCCLEKLRGFMDPCLEGNYQLGDALCLALLAKSCLDEDPLRRPTMNGVLKALSRMV